MTHIAELFTDLLFDGVAYAMILFIISFGLSITMGMMGFINLAHGAFAMAGGYVLVTLVASLGIPFLPSLLISFLVVALASALLERLLYTPLYKAFELDQMLLTLGLIYMSSATFTYFYGPAPQTIRVPAYLDGQIDLGFRMLPTYRVFLIVVGCCLIAGCWYVFERTRLGAMIRASVDNHRMAQSLGVHVDRLFTLTFALGSGLAALGGGLSIKVLGLTPGFATQYLVIFLIVVSVGGLGTLKGTLAAALVLGIFDTAGKYFYPSGSGFFIYAATVLILFLRPAGIYGRE